MNLFRILLINILFFCCFSCREITQENNNANNSTSTESNANFNFLPTSTTNAIYHHNTYSLSYDEGHEQAEWVAYYLDEEDIKYVNYDRPLFEVDEKVITGSAHWRNYKKSGYNKGHLLPAGDRRGSISEYTETFLTSNISPQTYAFNSGIWNRLEQKVRYWAQKNDGLYVVTAGVLSKDLETIGYEHVSVPKYFYKVLLTKDKTKMIAFLMPHQDSDKPLYKFVISVDELEKLTGIDFFPELNDSIENNLESTANYKNWSF